MMLPFRKALGLALTTGSAVVAEVRFGRARGHVVQTAEFAFPDAASLQDPAALGKALRQFLRQHHFSASRCVIGLDARCLAAKEKALPPVPADALAGALAIAAEREFASDPEALAVDCVGPLGGPQAQSVLLVAASRRTVDQAVAMAQAAGLTPLSVTASTMALDAATRGAQTPGRAVLDLSPGGVELAWGSVRGFRMIRRLSAASVPDGASGGPPARQAWVDGLADEVRRIVALLPVGDGSPPLGELLVWNGARLDAAELHRLGQRVGLAVQVGQPVRDLGLDGESAAPPDGGFAAAALAMGAFGKPSPVIDFLHSRLAPRKRFTAGRKVLWGAVAAGVLMAAALPFVLDWRENRHEVDRLQGELSAIDASAAEAKHVLDQASFARGWYDLRPRFLDCLRDVTLAFPREGKIWATNLAVREDMRVSLSGKAVDESAVLEVLDRLKESPSFAEVQPLYIRQAGGSVREVSFAVSLRFVGAH